MAAIKLFQTLNRKFIVPRQRRVGVGVGVGVGIGIGVGIGVGVGKFFLMP